MIEKLALVAAGGAIGASLRFLTVQVATRLAGHGFPVGTMTVNVLGSFAMGVLAVIMLERFPGSWTRGAPLLLTGVLGAYTTFSAFSLDAIFLVERGRLLAAGLYIGGSVVLSIGALMAGMALARALA